MESCVVCAGTQFNDGYCTNCGHLRPAPARSNHLPLILVGVGILVAICVVASVVGLGLWQWNRTRHTATTATATPTATSPTASPSATPTEAPPLTGAACLVGRWRETVYQADAEVNGVAVRMTGAGAIQDFGADGVLTYDAGAGVTVTGTAGGNTYTATRTGKFTINYQVVGTEIRYSNSQSSGGTQVWKRNGRQIDKQTLIGSLAPETFTCAGANLRLFSTDYAIELERVTA